MGSQRNKEATDTNYETAFKSAEIKAREALAEMRKAFLALVNKPQQERTLPDLQRQDNILLPREEKTMCAYRVWHSGSEPEGEGILRAEKARIVTNKKKYALLILREEIQTKVFINGEKVKLPSKLVYRMLCYVLKNKGAGGSALDIGEQVWREDNKGTFEQIKNRVRSRINSLNEWLSNKLDVKLEANELDEYELSPKAPKYCLIEKKHKP